MFDWSWYIWVLIWFVGGLLLIRPITGHIAYSDAKNNERLVPTKGEWNDAFPLGLFFGAIWPCVVLYAAWQIVIHNPIRSPVEIKATREFKRVQLEELKNKQLGGGSET